jgi:hypothetical protein
MYDAGMSMVMLDEAIGKLDDPDGVPAAELIAAFALRDRLDAWLSAAVGAFDRDEQYELQGATSMTAWLKDRCRQTGADAARTASMARQLRSLPHTAHAWRDGTLSTGHVRAICANVAERHLAKFAAVEEAMVAAFASLPVRDTADVMRQWAAAADDADPEDEGNVPVDALHLSETLDGRRELRGHLSADSAAEVEQALAHAAVDDPEVPLSVRNANALVELARFFNNHNRKAGARRNRPHLTILVREDDNGEPVGRTLGGTPVSQAKLRQWLCDGLVARMLTSRSRILDYGTDVASVPVVLWHAVAARDQRCRFPGCDRLLAFCEAHHIQPVEHGGPTVITNLALFCSRHHHRLHKPGWTAVLEPDGTLHITGPDGETRTTHPPALRDTLWPPGGDGG